MRYLGLLLLALILFTNLTACGGGSGGGDGDDAPSSTPSGSTNDNDSTGNADNKNPGGNPEFAYVTEKFSGELSRVNLSSGDIEVITSDLVGPSDLAIGNNGNVAYVNEFDGRALSTVNLEDGTIDTLVTGLTAPLDVDVLPDGQILLLDVVGGFDSLFRTQLLSVDVTTGERTVITDGLFQATDMVIESSEANSILLVAAGADVNPPGNATLLGRFEVYRVNLDTGSTELVGGNINTGLIEVGPERAQFDAEIGRSPIGSENRVIVNGNLRVNLETGDTRRIVYRGQAVGADFVFENDRPTFLAVSPTTLVRANPDTGAVETIANGFNLFDNPTGIDLEK